MNCLIVCALLAIVIIIHQAINASKKAKLQQEILRTKQQIIKEQNKLLEEYKNSYDLSLYDPTLDPTNATLKQQTLSLGREYSRWTRQFNDLGNRVTV